MWWNIGTLIWPAVLIVMLALSTYGWMQQNARTHTREWHEDRIFAWILKDLPALLVVDAV